MKSKQKSKNRLSNNDPSDNDQVFDPSSRFFENMKSNALSKSHLLDSSNLTDNLASFELTSATIASSDDDESVDFVAVDSAGEEEEDVWMSVGNRRSFFHHKETGEREHSKRRKGATENEDVENEELEAIQQQQSLLSLIAGNDYFSSTMNVKSLTAIPSDLLDLSTDQSASHIEKPANFKNNKEYDVIMTDLKSKVKLLANHLKPAFESSRVVSSNTSDAIVCRLFQFYSFYCSATCMYLAMCEEDETGHSIDVSTHPILNLMLNLRKIDAKIEPTLHATLNQIQTSTEPISQPVNPENADCQKANDCQVVEQMIVCRNENSKSGLLSDKVVSGTLNNMENDAANRMANSTILKNNPLSEHGKEASKRKKKLTKTPRTKLKRKFKKALTRRSAQIPNIRNKDKPYQGEGTGIHTSIQRSVKLH